MGSSSDVRIAGARKTLLQLEADAVARRHIEAAAARLDRCSVRVSR
jgi:hypothetical protein